MANNNNLTMDYLKKEGSIRVNSGMIVVYPQASREENFNVSGLVPKFNGCYATNNSTVCFVYENEIFVTPYTRAALSLLQSAGFREEYFYVPFSNGDYPKFEHMKWDFLREKARCSYANDFVEDCIACCDTHYIGELKDETLGNCFKMPTTGVKVKHINYEACYYPIINSNLN